VSKRVNALLLELLIVVLFFSLACIVLIRVFAGAAHLSLRAGDQNSALLEAQNLAEQIYAAENVGKLLENEIIGDDLTYDCFVRCGENVWEKDAAEGNGIRFRVTVTNVGQSEGDGVLREGRIEAFSSDDAELLFTLDCSRYIPGEAVGQ